MFQRYWRVALIGLGLGCLLGMVLYGLIAVGGNSTWPSYLTFDEVARSFAFYGFCGIVVAVVSEVGSWIAIWRFDRRLQKSPAVRIGAAAGGAALATLALGVVLAVVTTITSGTTAGAALPVTIAAVLALGSAFAAAVLVSVREGRFPPQMSGETRGS